MHSTAPSLPVPSVSASKTRTIPSPRVPVPPPLTPPVIASPLPPSSSTLASTPAPIPVADVAVPPSTPAKDSAAVQHAAAEEEATVNAKGMPLLLVMQVQVSKGVSDRILFYEGDEIETVVKEFANAHNLGTFCCPHIAIEVCPLIPFLLTRVLSFFFCVLTLF